ncbi:hypothetical protein NC652_010005 [Populus alba x Populus x berolinensis]|nr:hypothetical protein NC652_010005 [Populus alba x Populus x berolinensis]
MAVNDGCTAEVPGTKSEEGATEFISCSRLKEKTQQVVVEGHWENLNRAMMILLPVCQSMSGRYAVYDFRFSPLMRMFRRANNLLLLAW